MSTHGNTTVRKGFCIYIDALFEGPVPVERDEVGNPFVYDRLVAAERVIAEDAIGRLHEFLAGERDFDDAITIEEYVVPVDVLADGSVVDPDGHVAAPDTGSVETKSAVRLFRQHFEC